MSGPSREQPPTVVSALRGDPPVAATPQAVIDRRELAFIAMERTHTPMVVSDMRQPDYPVVMANQAFFDLTGYCADEVLGRNCRFLQGPETSEAAIAEVLDAILAGHTITIDLLNYRKNRSTFWNELHLSPIQDDTGAVIYMLASQRDVSDRHAVSELAASERRLLKEIDHRAMNVLALVNGIVRLSSSDSPSRYAAAVQRRVQSLAKAHSLLSSHGWHNVPLDELLQTQVQPYGFSQVELNGPAVALEAALVQPLSLVVHELTINAVMHGALSSSGGTVAIGWSTQRQSGEVDVTWSEAGGPAPPEQRIRGFGSTMVSSIIERQLGGVLRQTWHAGGLRAEMQIPLNGKRMRMTAQA